MDLPSLHVTRISKIQSMRPSKLNHSKYETMDWPSSIFPSGGVSYSILIYKLLIVHTSINKLSSIINSAHRTVIFIYFWRKTTSRKKVFLVSLTKSSSCIYKQHSSFPMLFPSSVLLRLFPMEIKTNSNLNKLPFLHRLFLE